MITYSATYDTDSGNWLLNVYRDGVWIATLEQQWPSLPALDADMAKIGLQRLET